MTKKKKTPAKKRLPKKEIPKHKLIKRLDKLLHEEELCDLTEKTGVAKATLSDWKLKRVPVSVSRAIEILKAYDIKVELKEKK